MNQRTSFQVVSVLSCFYAVDILKSIKQKSCVDTLDRQKSFSVLVSKLDKCVKTRLNIYKPGISSPHGSRTPVWPGSGPLDYKERWDNLAIVEVHCGACIVCDEANKVQPHCLILALWPRSRQGMLLLSLHLSPPLCPSELWQEGFQEQLWSVSACHSALVTPGERSPLWAWDGPEKGWILNGRARGCGTNSSVWHSRSGC